MTARRLCGFGTSAGLHMFVGMSLLWTVAASVSRAVGVAAPDHAMSVFAAGPPADPAALPGLNPEAASDDAMKIRRDSNPRELSIAGFTFDVGKISRSATMLFPFLTPGLRLESFGLAARRTISADQWRSAAQAGRAGEHGDEPPLWLSNTALQTLIDASWSRRDRWTSFQRIAALADRYSATTGQLAAVLHAYVEQDGLQPYVDASVPDPRLWTELGLAADHVQFIGFISRYAAAHPATEATTELLLLLDAYAQASLDALNAVVNTDLSELQWTRRANGDAYNLIIDVQAYYRAQLARRGLASHAALGAHYDRVRLLILNSILETTPHGYRASDVRYLIGAIYWKERDAVDAIRVWRDLAPDPTDSYAAACADILKALREPVGGQQTDAINRALDREHGRWVSRSFDRLRSFGFRFDTF
jgi:hypothetical protein